MNYFLRWQQENIHFGLEELLEDMTIRNLSFGPGGNHTGNYTCLSEGNPTWHDSNKLDIWVLMNSYSTWQPETSHLGLGELLHDMTIRNMYIWVWRNSLKHDSKKVVILVWRTSYRTWQQETIHLGLEELLHSWQQENKHFGLDDSIMIWQQETRYMGLEELLVTWQQETRHLSFEELLHDMTARN